MAAERTAAFVGKSNGFYGYISRFAPSLYRCGLWTLSCDFVPHN